MIALTAVAGAADVATPGPLIVELAGTPGSGKTSVAPGVISALREAGWDPYDVTDGARRVVSRMPAGRLVSRLRGERLRNALWWRLYLAHRLTGMGRVIARNPGHFARVAAHQRRRPAGAEVRRRRVLFWYLRTAGSQEFFRRHGADGDAVVFDEGQLHRVVQLFSSPVDRASDETVARYVDGVPQPDLVVAVRCSAVSSLERIRRRGVWARLDHLSEVELARFVSNADHVVGHAVRHAVSSGWRVAEIDNEKEGLPERAAVDVGASIPVAADTDAPRNHLLYRVHAPKPGRLTRMTRGRLSSPTISIETVDALLSEYGIRRTGRVATLPLGRRSDSVVVASDAGKLVVRAYSDHWLDESIRHEHSVLKHLESHRYPATRLVVATDGETVHTVDGRRMVVFTFAPGANLRGSFVSARTALEAIHLSGRLLARLHAITAGLRPEGSHHLAMDDTDGQSRLQRQLEVLERLTAAPARHPDAIWLNGRAPAIADRLGELHGLLMEAGLAISVIHGDFGLHNVLLRRDGSATVHDFELARRDWELVDIVESIARVPGWGKTAFLNGYRLEVGGAPAEWRHLGAMWEYHRLGGAVRSWESFVSRNDFERLAVARFRVEQAARVRAEGVGEWL